MNMHTWPLSLFILQRQKEIENSGIIGNVRFFSHLCQRLYWHMFEFLSENFAKGILQIFLLMKAANCLAYRTCLVFGRGKNRPCFLLYRIVQRQNNMEPPLFSAAHSTHLVRFGFAFYVLQITIPFSLIFELVPRFAVLPNPVPDRQPCSALCRVSSLGLLVQTEVMAGFPEKVSDWTVMHFYPKSKSSWGTAKSKYISPIFFEKVCK